MYSSFFFLISHERRHVLSTAIHNYMFVQRVCIYNIYTFVPLTQYNFRRSVLYYFVVFIVARCTLVLSCLCYKLYLLSHT